MLPWGIWWIIWQQTWGKKPMETQQRSTEYNFQGVMYFFRREKIQCRYQFSLRDAVDTALLQRALTTALASAPYYTQRLVQEKREMWLEPNTEPCLVYHGSTMRNIPEQTNGYLFCISCEGDTVYFDWHHFLLDGAIPRGRPAGSDASQSRRYPLRS